MTKKKTTKKKALKTTKVASADPTQYVTRGRREPVKAFKFGVDKTPEWFKSIEEDGMNYFETRDGTLRKVITNDYVVNTEKKGVMSMKRGKFNRHYIPA